VTSHPDLLARGLDPAEQARRALRLPLPGRHPGQPGGFAKVNPSANRIIGGLPLGFLFLAEG
jgi:hypothetical protein